MQSNTFIFSPNKQIILSNLEQIKQIPRTAQVGQRVGTVTAVDQDAGSDGIVRYDMEGSAVHYLSIDGVTGQIVLTGQLENRYILQENLL